MTTLDEEDRREYYRIEDRIALQISPLSAAEALETDLLQDASPLFNLLSELHLADFESQHLMRQLSEKDRTLAAFLRVQNKRLDLLGAVLAQTLLGEIGQAQRVILSEGGIEFAQAAQIAPGTRVAVKMVLMPRAHGLLLRGRVTHCDPRPQGDYEVGTEFVDMTDAQRQLLARYILQRQQQQRRQLREQDESAS
ncbi:PilZ domain-containing protein [Pseudomonas guariconensis]|uniref:PilZ domain-containing protein n=1 Tax=Pseudomonas TaxID=286 RepID=UPI001CE48B88|nr:MULTISPECIES: PilZ domain-containing protein [Pseudomonas]MCO7636287.1 PilZ domain-containing protein [Pseudomonas sp. S 311-6]MCO7515042.1 PilZ domain-containing protein [Pseudomonas putida]MCO7563870.1 PilZ domain-containing protein [Pseudomonas mosselii]MCO7594224.1 PilZ domain-containing protein [Pseudomonas guariconensis]MCO7604818.1 PilZ domain-containing protein [Pseudomonas guariconensis]